MCTKPSSSIFLLPDVSSSRMLSYRVLLEDKLISLPVLYVINNLKLQAVAPSEKSQPTQSQLFCMYVCVSILSFLHSSQA